MSATCNPPLTGGLCPIENPEGPNIGLIGSLSSYARVNAFGFVETARTARSSRRLVIDQIYYLPPTRRTGTAIAQSNTLLVEDGTIARASCGSRRRACEVRLTPAGEGSTTWTCPRADGVRATRHDPVPQHRRRQPRPEARTCSASRARCCRIEPPCDLAWIPLAT